MVSVNTWVIGAYIKDIFVRVITTSKIIKMVRNCKKTYLFKYLFIHARVFLGFTICIHIWWRRYQSWILTFQTGLHVTEWALTCSFTMAFDRAEHLLRLLVLSSIACRWRCRLFLRGGCVNFPTVFCWWFHSTRASFYVQKY